MINKNFKFHFLFIVNATLQTRAQTRRASHHTGDDGLGSKSASHAYFDDTFTFLPYEDLPTYISTFQELGAPLGIILNKQKT
jgi:hypothetical protein